MTADPATQFTLTRKDELAKDGMLLFREFLRVFPTADVNDYFKNGVWNKNLIKLDTEVVTVHRQEAGADKPPHITEIKEPALPGYPKGWVPPPQQQINPPLGVPGGVSTIAATLAAAAIAAKAMGPKAQLLMSPLGSIAAAGSLQTAKALGMPNAKAAMQISPAKAASLLNSPLSPADVEGRMVAGFATKWNIDPQSVKDALDAISPVRRRWVIANFQNPESTGKPSLEALTEFIAHSNETNAWAAATPGVALLGVKRPLITAPGGEGEPALKKLITVGAAAGMRPPLLGLPGGQGNASAGMQPQGFTTASGVVRPPGLTLPGVVRPPGLPGAGNNASGAPQVSGATQPAAGGLMRPPAMLGQQTHAQLVRPHFATNQSARPVMPRPLLSVRPQQ